MKLPEEKATEILDFSDITEKDFTDVLESLRAEEGLQKFAPDGICRIDPRTNARVIFSEKRAKRPHDNKPADAPAPPESGKDCPVCAGNTTQIIDMQPLSEGFTFINKNLFPILYPDTQPDPDFNYLAPPVSPEATPAYGMHFLQWPSNYHDRDFHNMHLEDIKVVLERLARLEETILNSGDPDYPIPPQDDPDHPHHGYSGIIKNYGHLVGGSLAHGHNQIAFSSIMPQVIAQDLDFHARVGHDFASYMLESNPPELLLEENEHFACLVPYFMKRPLQAMILYKHEGEYFHHIPSGHLASLAPLLRKLTASVMTVMEQIGREPAYNIIFHSGPGAPFYLEMLPYTQETGGYEHLGIWVCQGSPESSVQFYKENGEFGKEG